MLHAQPAYTVEETRQGPFSLLISLSASGDAYGTAYIDDGISDPPGPSTSLTFTATAGQLRISSKGSFNIQQKLEGITILGVDKPKTVSLNDHSLNKWTYTGAQRELVLSLVAGDLNGDLTVSWK